MKTIQEFKSRAIALFERNNYLQRGTEIEWKGARKVTWKDGSKGFSGEFEVSHPSHKTSLVVAGLKMTHEHSFYLWVKRPDDSDGLMVR